MSVQWLRRLFDHLDESPLARMSYLTNPKRFGSAAATQFIHSEIAEWYASEELGLRYSIVDTFNSATRVSRLKFEYQFGIGQPENSGSIMQLMAMLKNKRFYFLILRGVHIKPEGIFVTALASVLGCCFGPPPEPSPFAHAIALAYNDAGPSKIFDINLGEFEIEQSQLERFFIEHWRSYKAKGFAIQKFYIFEVTLAKEFAPAHNHLGRSWDLNCSDLV